LKNIKSQYFENNIYLSSEDLLLMQLSLYRAQTWYNHLLHVSKQKKYILQIFDGHHFLGDTKKLIKVKNICFTKKFLDFQTPGNILLIEKYINLLKSLVKINKSNTQKNLIQQINACIRYQDRSFCRSLNQKKSKWVNNSIYQHLLSWGMSRHNNHSIKWSKKRYWYYFEDGMYFSVF
jgi:hypothetical protein